MLALALMIGPFPLHAADIWHAIARLLGIDEDQATSGEIVFVRVRMPRVVAAALVGAALAGSGTAYQTLFRNPLVSPDILGVSAGAGRFAGLSDRHRPARP
jgi:iron complex transport system permease protein